MVADDDRGASVGEGAERRGSPFGMVPRPPRWVSSIWRKFAHRPLLLAATVAAVAAGFTLAGTESIAWMETPQFCGQCHTMGPEVRAHELSTHETVECGECHVGEGLMGLAKAKIGGMRQTLALVLGEYAHPIEPAAHIMPPANETCGRCHDPARQRGDRLITRSHFRDDERNSEQQVALIVRLGDDTKTGETQGIHWHVLSNVTYVTAPVEGEHGESAIAWVGVEKPDGTREEYVAKNSLHISSQAGARAEELRATGHEQRMSCYDCHNRIGHDFPSVARSIDQALANKTIDQGIPFIKKRAVEVLNKRYATVDEADAALRNLRAQYLKEYPNLWLDSPKSVEATFVALAEIYRKSARPEMNVTSADYPNQLGHTESTGCFRCHDGGHNKIVDGRITDETIPATCSTCHTFPSVGEAPAVPLGAAPQSHAKTLWVFDHKKDPAASAPNTPDCSACHSQSYCSNCHTSGAKLVKHDEMRFDHAAVIRKTGQQACNYCHQQPYCARCHVENKPSDGLLAKP